MNRAKGKYKKRPNIRYLFLPTNKLVQKERENQSRKCIKQREKKNDGHS